MPTSHVLPTCTIDDGTDRPQPLAVGEQSITVTGELLNQELPAQLCGFRLSLIPSKVGLQTLTT